MPQREEFDEELCLDDFMGNGRETLIDFLNRQPKRNFLDDDLDDLFADADGTASGSASKKSKPLGKAQGEQETTNMIDEDEEQEDDPEMLKLLKEMEGDLPDDIFDEKEGDAEIAEGFAFLAARNEEEEELNADHEQDLFDEDDGAVGNKTKDKIKNSTSLEDELNQNEELKRMAENLTNTLNKEKEREKFFTKGTFSELHSRQQELERLHKIVLENKRQISQFAAAGSQFGAAGVAPAASGVFTGTGAGAASSSSAPAPGLFVGNITGNSASSSSSSSSSNFKSAFGATFSSSFGNAASTNFGFNFGTFNTAKHKNLNVASLRNQRSSSYRYSNLPLSDNITNIDIFLADAEKFASEVRRADFLEANHGQHLAVKTAPRVVNSKLISGGIASNPLLHNRLESQLRKEMKESQAILDSQRAESQLHGAAAGFLKNGTLFGSLGLGGESSKTPGTSTASNLFPATSRGAAAAPAPALEKVVEEMEEEEDEAMGPPVEEDDGMDIEQDLEDALFEDIQADAAAAAVPPAAPPPAVDGAASAVPTPTRASAGGGRDLSTASQKGLFPEVQAPASQLSEQMKAASEKKMEKGKIEEEEVEESNGVAGAGVMTADMMADLDAALEDLMPK
ncbi:unnamed protein product [Amoebophrya sp. A120]|nr:unnamed protein product [Amoebophrya sp. A120]|eukprot:GSA120T00020477001.1